jgi:hypothetical protein
VGRARGQSTKARVMQEGRGKSADETNTASCSQGVDTTVRMAYRKAAKWYKKNCPSTAAQQGLDGSRG